MFGPVNVKVAATGLDCIAQKIAHLVDQRLLQILLETGKANLTYDEVLMELIKRSKKD
jgi:hypothetical protein